MNTSASTSGSGFDTGKKELDDGAISKTAFEALERDFQEVLNELAGDESLEKFKIEYEKLHRALRKSRESEKRLIKKCNDLSSEIVANAAKVHTALKLSQEDQNTIASLRKEIDKAWKMYESAHERELRAKETVQQLKQQIQHLSTLVGKGADLSAGQEATVNELLRVKEELSQELDEQNQQIARIRKENDDLRQRIRSLEDEKVEKESEVSKLRTKYEEQVELLEKETNRKSTLEGMIKELRKSIEIQNAEVQNKQSEVSRQIMEVKKLEEEIAEERLRAEQRYHELQEARERVAQKEHELNQYIAQNSVLEAQNSEMHAQIASKEDDVQRVKKQQQQVQHMLDRLKRKYEELEGAKGSVEDEVGELKAKIEAVEHELQESKKKMQENQRTIVEYQREKDILYKNLLKSEFSSQQQNSSIKVAETRQKNMEQELQGYRAALAKLNKEISDLERQKDKYAEEASKAHEDAHKALEIVKTRDMKIIDLQKTIAELEVKLKNQQGLYESVRSDRNLYSKQLLESQDEISELHQKFKIMNHQIEQLKDEIAAKEKILAEEKFQVMKIEKEKEWFVQETIRLKQQHEIAESSISSFKQEMQNLQAIILEAERDRVRQKKQYEIVLDERDILGTQLIRRNDELALLYEKIRIQQSTLNKGEVQYNNRIQDVKILKRKINELRRELHILKASVSNIDKLKKEVVQLQKELREERARVRALSEELDNPLNVHRWRKLEGSDPSTFEMIQKIQTLQKRLIAKTEEVVEKDILIQEKEKLYVELKKILARQPGPEVAEQLNIYQQTLKDKTHQMKAMAAELNMFQAQVNEYKYEIEHMSKELQGVKKKYYDQKRKEHQQREQDMSAVEDIQVSHVQNGPRVRGGGFALASLTN